MKRGAEERPSSRKRARDSAYVGTPSATEPGGRLSIDSLPVTPASGPAPDFLTVPGGTPALLPYHGGVSPVPSPTKSQGSTSPGEHAKVAVRKLQQPAPVINLNHMIGKNYKRASLHDLADQTPCVLSGLEGSERLLGAYGIMTVYDLANWPPYRLARAIKTLSEGESTTTGRVPGSRMNVHCAFETRYESLTFKDLLPLPLSSMVSLGSRSDDDFKHFGIASVEDLALWKQPAWAEAISALSPYEHRAN
ncbi:hypothetical protein DIPPA_22772 [Diplonema papillatum]|nr:hypothetical protein DIPPA_22772 [Diplonema papillatum]